MFETIKRLFEEEEKEETAMENTEYIKQQRIVGECMKQIHDVMNSTGLYNVHWASYKPFIPLDTMDDFWRYVKRCCPDISKPEHWIELNKELLHILFLHKKYDAIEKIDEILEDTFKRLNGWNEWEYRRLDLKERSKENV